MTAIVTSSTQQLPAVDLAADRRRRPTPHRHARRRNLRAGYFEHQGNHRLFIAPMLQHSSLYTSVSKHVIPAGKWVCSLLRSSVAIRDAERQDSITMSERGNDKSSAPVNSS